MGILTLCKTTTLRNFSLSSDCFAAQNRNGIGDQEADYSTNNLTIARSQTAGGDPYPPSVLAQNLQECHSNQ